MAAPADLIVPAGQVVPAVSMNNKEGHRNRLRWTAIVLMAIIGLNAMMAGYSFIMEPSGEGLGMTTDYLRHSPFRTFLIPGLVLFIMNGVLNLAAALTTILKTEEYYRAILFQGLVLTGWIVVQVVMVRDFNLLHFACLSIGIALLYLGRKIRNSQNVALKS